MRVGIALGLLVIAASVHGQSFPRCGQGLTLLNATSGEEITLPVAAVDGAVRYRVHIASRWSVVDVNRFLVHGTIVDQTYFPGSPIRETLYSTNGDLGDEVYIDVIAEVPQGDGSRFFCSQDFLVEIGPDPSLGRNATRAVVPVAGSVRGAFNSTFKTRILLENRWDVGAVSGRIVFHRAGTPGTPADPSIPYNLEPHSFVVFEDVVGAMHLDGVLGSLDIVPDAAPSGTYALPQIRADLISVGANGGAYSASIPVVTSTSGGQIPMVVSGGGRNVDALEGHPAILDLQSGRGHVLAFNFNPLHRDLNRSDFRMLWNGILNWKKIVGE